MQEILKCALVDSLRGAEPSTVSLCLFIPQSRDHPDLLLASLHVFSLEKGNFVPVRLSGVSGCHSNMASSWSARSSNMLPMSSRIFPAAFTVLLPLWNRQDNVTSLLMRVYRLKLFRCCLPVTDRGQNLKLQRALGTKLQT